MAYNDPETLMYRAECYRQLAVGMSDNRTQLLLLEQAVEYENRARHMAGLWSPSRSLSPMLKVRH